MNHTTTWTFEANDNVSETLHEAQANVQRATEGMRQSWQSLVSNLRPIDWQAATEGFQRLTGLFSASAQVGADYEKALLDVAAITGITGDDLDNLGDKARNLAKEFGGSASDNLATFQTILSRLGPQIG